MARVLIVDDDMNIRTMVSSLLGREGFYVLEAGNGRECFYVLDKQHVDIVIVDMLMPEVDGIETIQGLKKRGKEMKIIGISGGGRLHGAEYLVLAKKLGADTTLLKPFGKNEILRAINALL